jgi:branched-chain amino acid transport system permease protein
MFIGPSWRQLAPLLIVLLVGLLLPRMVADYFLFIGNLLLMYAVLAIGLDLLIGWAGQFAFAHIAFFGIGAYGTALLQMRFGLPWIVSMPLAAMLAGLVGVLIALPTMRMRSVYLALATFAFAEAAKWVFNSWTEVTGGPDGLRLPTPVIFGYRAGTDPSAFPLLALIFTGVMAATLYIVTSKFGRAMCAIRESEHVAAASGINVPLTKMLAFAVSAIYAGIAGGMLTLYQAFFNPEVFGFGQVVLVLSMMVVGGMGTLPGVLIGVLLIGLLPELMRTAMRGLLVWQELVYGLILMLFMMFMPRGIWGLVQQKLRARRA